MQSLYDREELYVQSLEGDIGQRAMAFLHHCYMSSTSSLPSNSTYTMSNIPGAGRIIDKFIYSRGGRLLQGAMDRFAHRMGMGPIACAQRVEKLLQSRRVQKLYLMFMEEPLPGFRQGGADEEDIQMISKECMKLVNFVMTEIESNQILALWCIKDLIVRHPGLSHCLSDPDVVDRFVSLNQEISQFTLLLQSTLSYIQNRDRERSRVLELLDEEGLGPTSIVERINESLENHHVHKLHTLVMGYDLNSKGKFRAVVNEVDENCRQLLSYLQTENISSQVKILKQIRNLTADHPGLDCCFYKYLDIFRAVSAKAGAESTLKAELKKTMASISDSDSVHAKNLTALLLSAGCGPAAIVDCIRTDLSHNALEILFTLMVGCDLFGTQAYRLDAKATSNNCDRLMAYVSLSKSHSLQSLVLREIESLVKEHRGLSCCFKTQTNLLTFTELMQRDGSRIKPQVTRAQESIMGNNLELDTSLRELITANGYSQDTLLPFMPTKRIRDSLKERPKDKILALLRELSTAYPSDGFADDVAELRRSCAELMGLITSYRRSLLKILALKNLEQILLEFPDLIFYFVKEYSGIISGWHDSDSKSSDLPPRLRQLMKSIAGLVVPKMAFLASTDWTRSKFIDHMFVSAFQTQDTENDHLKGHVRWDSDATTVEFYDRIAFSFPQIEAQVPNLLNDWKLE